MWRVTLRGVAGHRVRFLRMALAVLLGVAFVAGTFVLTDTINGTFDSLYSTIYRTTSAVVRGQEAFNPGTSFQSQRRLVDASLATTIRSVPGVREVRLGIDGYAQLVGRNGKAIGVTANGPPTIGEAWTSATDLNPFQLLPGGRPPRNASEVVIDKHSAEVGHLTVGDRVVVLSKLAPRRYTITGIATWGAADSPLGASVVLFDPTTAMRVLGEPGKVSEIDVAATPGVSQTQLVERLQRALGGHNLDIVTGATVTAEGQAAVHDAIGVFNTFLLAFALIALFVGSFLVFNTFSIVVSQRTRELALLRAVGASKAQVTAAVLGESLVVGLVASLLGLAAGIALAAGLKALLAVIGLSIPATGLVVGARTVLVALAVGTVVTVAAALLPARRAARIPPIAALRLAAAEAEGASTRRVVLGTVLAAGGLGVLAVGLFAQVTNRLAFVGGGAAVLFLGIATLGPLVARPVTRVLGTPFARRGASGGLARENAMRSPRRTASTAAALMIGVALVSVMTVVAASTKASVSGIIDSAMRADFVISSGAFPGGQAGLSPVLEQQLDRLPEVGAVTGIRASLARVGGATTTVLATDPRQVDQLFNVGVVRGQVASMTPNGIAVSQHVAEADHLSIGSHVPVTFARSGRQVFTVQAVYTARELAGDYVLTLAAARADFAQQLDFQIFVKLAPGTQPASGRAAIKKLLSAYPTATLMDQTQYKAQQAGQIDQALNLVYGLLGLAVLIALIGIANTLGLSVQERTRELGLLRAVGMTRGQLRASVRAESLLIALFGAIQGLVIGTLLGIAMVAALHGQGVTRLDVPVVQLLVVTVVAALAGVVAAASPARRAARLDILQAIAAE